MDDQKNEFIEGAIKNDISEKEASKYLILLINLQDTVLIRVMQQPML